MPDTPPMTFTSFGELLKHLRQRARVARLESNQRLPDVSAVRARFVDALRLKDEPGMAARLIELAAAARDSTTRDTLTERTATAPQYRVPNNLPAQLTSFIGRERELAELKTLLLTTRLLTLTGSGGVGKTRLALEVAPEVLGDYPEGVYLVELAPLSDPALVPQTVASVLGVHEQQGYPIIDALVDALRPKRLLLILDNCEHLIEACAQLANTCR